MPRTSRKLHPTRLNIAASSAASVCTPSIAASADADLNVILFYRDNSVTFMRDHHALPYDYSS